MADFLFYLNRQGAKGEKGDKGDKGDPGNTPIPSTGTNTPTEYTIVWDLGDGNSFETGNLKQPTVDQGGTTLRYDRANDQIVLGEPDLASTDNMTPGIVYLADNERIENEDVQNDDAVTYKVFKDKTDDLQEQITDVKDDLDDLADVVNQNSDDIESLDGRLDDEEANMLIVQGDITTLNDTKASKTELSSGLATKANVVHDHTMSQITDAGTLAKKNTVDYQTEVINKPTIPTPGNGTITINQGGILKGTFNVNQNNNSTINLDAGGGGGGGTTYTEGPGIDITNDTISVNYDSDKGLTTDISTEKLGIKVDGTTVDFDSLGNLTVVGGGGGSTILKKTITQASANVSELSGTVTVTDVDVTTSTIVNLYPTDTTTEDWLANNLTSNIITEGSGLFKFTINGTLPLTFSMYYTIQEVS